MTCKHAFIIRCRALVHPIKCFAPSLVSRRVLLPFDFNAVSFRDPFDGFFAYGAAKAGLNTLGLALARAGSGHGIRVHTVAPGATDTEMFRSLPGMRDFPTEKTMDPADVARVIVQCACGELMNTSGEVIYLHRGA